MSAAPCVGSISVTPPCRAAPPSTTTSVLAACGGLMPPRMAFPRCVAHHDREERPRNSPPLAFPSLGKGAFCFALASFFEDVGSRRNAFMCGGLPKTSCVATSISFIVVIILSGVTIVILHSGTALPLCATRRRLDATAPTAVTDVAQCLFLQL